MASLAIRLPLTFDSSDGYTTIKGLKVLVRQNLKMLILTVPGERVMHPKFGVGIKKFLFENAGTGVYAEIDTKIREQVRAYLPIVQILEIKFGTDGIDNNLLAIYIRYSIPDLNIQDLLEFTI
jgi:hypothetical protein